MFIRTIFALALGMALTAVGAQAGNLLVVHHKVADYAKWRPGFDAHKATQEASGLTNPHVYQAASNPNDITITFDMADLEKAKAFTSSKDLKDTMKKLGVKGKPEILFLNETH